MARTIASWTACASGVVSLMGTEKWYHAGLYQGFASAMPPTHSKYEMASAAGFTLLAPHPLKRVPVPHCIARVKACPDTTHFSQTAPLPKLRTTILRRWLRER